LLQSWAPLTPDALPPMATFVWLLCNRYFMKRVY
jgi:hypothetical protein